jgi:hypothetical protein
VITIRYLPNFCELDRLDVTKLVTGTSRRDWCRLIGDGATGAEYGGLSRWCDVQNGESGDRLSAAGAVGLAGERH